VGGGGPAPSARAMITKAPGQVRGPCLPRCGRGPGQPRRRRPTAPATSPCNLPVIGGHAARRPLLQPPVRLPAAGGHPRPHHPPPAAHPPPCPSPPPLQAAAPAPRSATSAGSGPSQPPTGTGRPRGGTARRRRRAAAAWAGAMGRGATLRAATTAVGVWGHGRGGIGQHRAAAQPLACRQRGSLLLGAGAAARLAVVVPAAPLPPRPTHVRPGLGLQSMCIT